MSAQERDAERVTAAKAALERIDREAHAGLLGPGFARAFAAFTARPRRAAESRDQIEIWGRRIGRTLGLAAATLLALNLFTHWLF